MKHHVAVIALIACASATHAGELPRPKVLRSQGANERVAAIKSVVVAPPICDGAVDCSAGAREIALHARAAMHLRTIDASTAEQAAFDAGAEIKDSNDAAKIAERLGVDAALLARLVSHETVPQSSYGANSFPVVQVAVQLDLVTRDGTVLVRGTFNEAWQGADRAFAGACKAIMREAFPKK